MTDKIVEIGSKGGMKMHSGQITEANLCDTAAFVKELPGEPLLNILPYHNYGEMKQVLNRMKMECRVGGYKI